MKHLLPTLIACAALAVAGTAQPASFTLVGTACTTSEGPLQMGNNGLPVSGRSFQVTYRGPNRVGGTYDYHPFLIVGFDLLEPGFVIPPAWFVGQPANCTLHVSLDVVVPMRLSPLVRPAYVSEFTFGIPRNPALRGMSFHVQWLTTYYQCGIVPPCVFPWVATSEAATATIGT